MDENLHLWVQILKIQGYERKFPKKFGCRSIHSTHTNPAPECKKEREPPNPFTLFLLINKALQNSFIIADFEGFCEDIANIYKKVSDLDFHNCLV